MDSVYKLSKYSQKIGEACRAKQLDKVIEYNKHELAYINKLSKYFNNQKGGATVEQVFAAIRVAIDKQTAQLEEQMQELNTQLVDAQRKAGTAKRLEADLGMYKTKNEELGRELNMAVKEANEAIQVSQTREAELARVNQQLQVLQSAQTQEQGQDLAQAQLQEELTVVKKENTELKTQYVNLQQELTEVRTQAEQDQLKLGELKKQAEQNIEAVHAQLRQELDTTKQELQKLSQKLKQQVDLLPPAQIQAQSKGGSKRKIKK